MYTNFFRPGLQQRWFTAFVAVSMALTTALATLVGTAKPAYAQYRDPAYAEFYQTLDQHGEWIEHPRYGMTWSPYANQDRNWRPYSRGQWVLTEEHGWYWESDEDFGWVVYHYGRWLLDDRHGWMWVPGREWGPAWVAWRESDEAIGWAPLPPEAEFNGSGEGVMTYDAFAAPRYAPMWMFVAPGLMLMPAVYRHFYPYQRSSFYFGQSRFVTHYSYRDRHVYNRGVDRRFIEMRTQRPVPVLQVRPMASPRDFGGQRRIEGDNRHVGIYRPQMAPAPQRGAPGQGGPGFGHGQGPGPGFGQGAGRPPQQGYGGAAGAPGSIPHGRPFGQPDAPPHATPHQPDPGMGSAPSRQQPGPSSLPGGRPFGGSGGQQMQPPQTPTQPQGGPPQGFGGGFGGRPQPQAMPPAPPPQRPQVQAPPPTAPPQAQRPPQAPPQQQRPPGPPPPRDPGQRPPPQ